MGVNVLKWGCLFDSLENNTLSEFPYIVLSLLSYCIIFCELCYFMCLPSLFIQIGGMEVDLPRLYKIVQSFGGLKEVIEKKKWHRVADGMKIPKSAQDRVTKLDDIYCKYLLPYDTLSPGEELLG
jgi:hypothetical protein